MEIKVNIDEAKIVRDVMQGLSTKDIQRDITETLKERVKDKVIELVKIDTMIEKLTDNWEKKLKEKVYKDAQEKVLKAITPEKIKKMLRKEYWDSWLENTVGNTLSEFIEHALNEWLTLEFNVAVGGKKKKTISLAGVNSYTHRKK